MFGLSCPRIILTLQYPSIGRPQGPMDHSFCLWSWIVVVVGEKNRPMAGSLVCKTGLLLFL